MCEDKKRCVINDCTLYNYLTIIKNLFNLSISSDVFLHTQDYLRNKSHNKICNINKTNFKGRRPKWLDNINKEFHLLFRLLDKKYFSEFYCELFKINDCEISMIFDQFKIYDNTIEFQLLDNELYNIRHRLLSYVIKHNLKKLDNKKIIENNESTKKIYIMPTDYEKNQLKNTDIPIPPRDYTDSKNITHKINQVRKTLDCKRHFTIDKDIICFDFIRRHIDHKHFLDKYYYNWEYYAYNCELWKERMDNYQVSFSLDKTYNNLHEFNYVCFPNDDLLEDFYEKFGYETDEQTKEVTERSLIDLHGHDIISKDWLKKIFNYEGDFKENILYF